MTEQEQDYGGTRVSKGASSGKGLKVLRTAILGRFGDPVEPSQSDGSGSGEEDAGGVETSSVCKLCGEGVKSHSWLYNHLIDEHPRAALGWLVSDWERNFKRAMHTSGSATSFGAEYDFMEKREDWNDAE